ncbi:MAG: leucine-rich repeat domain-containing protein [Vicinamibacterales bacterium]
MDAVPPLPGRPAHEDVPAVGGDSAGGGGDRLPHGYGEAEQRSSLELATADLSAAVAASLEKAKAQAEMQRVWAAGGILDERLRDAEAPAATGRKRPGTPSRDEERPPAPPQPPAPSEEAVAAVGGGRCPDPATIDVLRQCGRALVGGSADFPSPEFVPAEERPLVAAVAAHCAEVRYGAANAAPPNVLAGLLAGLRQPWTDVEIDEMDEIDEVSRFWTWGRPVPPPPSVTRVRLTNTERLAEIPQMSSTSPPRGVVAVTCGPGLESVTVVESPFLDHWCALTAVDLSGLCNVTRVGGAFLSCCCRLRALDLRPLSNVTQIGPAFLSRCHALTSVDVRPLRNVTQIGGAFLGSCRALTSVDLSGLCNVTQIFSGFLCGCHALTSVDLSGLCNVTQIGSGFLRDCHALTSVDLSGLCNVTQIDNDFLRDCHALTSVDLSGPCNVTQIWDNFLRGCRALTSVDLTGLRKLRLLGDAPLADCPRLTVVRRPFKYGIWRRKTLLLPVVDQDLQAANGGR